MCAVTASKRVCVSGILPGCWGCVVSLLLLLLLAMAVSCVEGAGVVPLSLCSSVPFTCRGGLGAALLARPGPCGGDLEGEWLLLY